MESIKVWARHGERAAGHRVGRDGAHRDGQGRGDRCVSAVCDRTWPFKRWARSFPEPRCEPALAMEVSLPAHIAARFAGLYAMRKAGDGLRAARV